MGYTHYFTQTRDLTDGEFAEVREIMDKVIAGSNVPVGDWSGDPINERKATFWRDEGVGFNGLDDDAHETFCIPQKREVKDYQSDDFKGFLFCKTARKSYDTLVVACLCRIEQRMPGAFRIDSDGGPDEWEMGLELARRIFDDPTIRVPEAVE